MSSTSTSSSSPNTSSSSSSSLQEASSSNVSSASLEKTSPLTVRMVMNGKEVGSIIGKGGEIINSIRESSGAKIHISDGSVPERIVTISGPTEAIFKSFKLICKKLEEDREPRPPITLRLIVPASQCGSLIGKGGSKIKEMREISGASIQVASEMLPNSTERAVTVSGTKEAIAACILHVCYVMLESPPKGSTIPYHPSKAAPRAAREGPPNAPVPLASLLTPSLMAIASLLRHKGGAGSPPEESTARSSPNNTSFEMSIPNESIGCIIGKGGSKIAEIRHISNAMIRISKSEAESEKERLITISGSPEAVSLGKSLINMSLDLAKSESGAALNLGLLLSKPETLTALTSLASLTSLGGSLLGGLVSGGPIHSAGQVTGAHRSSRNGGGGSSSSSSGNRSTRDDDRGRDSKRSKFAPY